MGQSSSREIEVNGYKCVIGPKLESGDTNWGKDEGLAVFALVPAIETGGFLSNPKSHRSISKLSSGGFALRRAVKITVLKDRHNLRHVLAERKALAEFAHEAPYVDHLFKAFQTEFELLLVTELLDGGSLRTHIKSEKDGRFDEEKARFYAAQLLTALTHVHQAKFAHRDVRLDNLVLNAKGHCTLVNFTMAIRVGALTSAGSSSYHLLSVGHSPAPSPATLSAANLHSNHSNSSLHSSTSSLTSTPPPSLASSSAAVPSTSSPLSGSEDSSSIEATNEAVHGMSSALLAKQQEGGLAVPSPQAPTQKAGGKKKKKLQAHSHDHHDHHDCMCHSNLYASFAKNEVAADGSELALKLKPPKKRTGRTSPSGPLSEFTASSHPYMAPELYRREFHDQTVDWWSFGVCLFEMLTGKLPFPANHSSHELDFTSFSEVISPEAQDLLSKLLNSKMDERLRTANEIKEHPFFSSVDWQAFLQRKVKPPFVPSPSRLIPDPSFHSQALRPNEDTRIPEAEQLLFKHWDWDITDSSSKQRRILSQADIWHLYQVFSDPVRGVKEAERQSLFRTYAKCWVGADGVDWILEHVAEAIDGISGIQRSEALGLLNYWWRKHLIKGVNESQEQVEDTDLFFVFTNTVITPGEPPSGGKSPSNESGSGNEEKVAH